MEARETGERWASRRSLVGQLEKAVGGFDVVPGDAFMNDVSRVAGVAGVDGDPSRSVFGVDLQVGRVEPLRFEVLPDLLAQLIGADPAQDDTLGPKLIGLKRHVGGSSAGTAGFGKDVPHRFAKTDNDGRRGSERHGDSRDGRVSFHKPHSVLKGRAPDQSARPESRTGNTHVLIACSRTIHDDDGQKMAASMIRCR